MSLLLFLSTNIVTSSLFLIELNSPKGRIKQVINATNVLMLHVIVKFYQHHMFQDMCQYLYFLEVYNAIKCSKYKTSAVCDYETASFPIIAT